LTLRQSAIAQIQEATMTQSLETIERRINALGLTEPTIQLHGRKDNEILIQLPGEGDPARIRDVIQAGGQLELRLVEGPTAYASQADAFAQNNGVLPAGTELLPGKIESRGAVAPSGGEVWYLVSRAPVVTGRDLRTAQESRNASNPASGRSISLFRRRCKTLRTIHRTESPQAACSHPGPQGANRAKHQWQD